MPAIDSILRMVIEQKASELRLTSDEVPRLLRGDEPLRFFMPATSTDTLRGLLGELLSPTRWEAARAATQRFTHQPADLKEDFQVTLRRQDDSMSLRFVRSGAAPRSTAPAPVATAPEAPRSAPSHSAGPADSLEALLRTAHRRGASDLHLSDREPPTLRVDGRLFSLDQPVPPLRRLLSALLTGPRMERIAAGRAVDLAIDQPGLRARVNVYPHAGGLAAAVRLLRRTPPTLEALGLPMPLDELLRGPAGLVLVCGPTGSGKSTTMAALAQRALKQHGGLLVTLEDPIEYNIEAGPGALVRQRELGQHLASFSEGLRAALREDPDLLLVGELRDAATIGLALTAADTGHRVLSTLHSGSATGAVERIIDVTPAGDKAQARAQLAASLRAVVVQRLLPRASGEGRVLALEVLRNTYAVANMIRDNRSAQLASALQSGVQDGMLSMERCLSQLVKRGEITAAVARTAANDRQSLERYLGG